MKSLTKTSMRTLKSNLAAAKKNMAKKQMAKRGRRPGRPAGPPKKKTAAQIADEKRRKLLKESSSLMLKAPHNVELYDSIIKLHGKVVLLSILIVHGHCHFKSTSKYLFPSRWISTLCMTL
jgi:hypothetical protein